VLCVQSFVIKTLHHNILIDSCVGNHKPRTARPFWHMLDSDRFEKNLRATGLGFDDIDYVMCTHLHGDHVGWNTRLDNGRWVPTFPKARYVFGQHEYEYWATQNAKAEVPPFADSVLPVVEAGNAEIVTDEFAIGDHVRIVPTPGHTPGHIAIAIGKGKDDAVFAGDLIHTPLQLRYPELSPKFDVDPAQAATTRRQFLERYCDTETLCCPAHFPSPSIGKIRRKGTAFSCEAV
jgi:glyoxylase-like metal-dependent hydrolase (beta-lactamase superfamily II)